MIFFSYLFLYQDRSGAVSLCCFFFDLRTTRCVASRGNRLTKNTDTYPSTSSKLSTTAGNALTYDAAGNITSDTTRTFTYDVAGRIATLSIGGSTVGTYTYDANNLRTKKVTSASTTHYVYGQGGLLYGEYDNTGALIREYVYLNGEPLAQTKSRSVRTLSTYSEDRHGFLL